LKRIISVAMAFAVALSTLTAGASVLGSEVVYTNTTRFAEGTYFTKNIFYSDQSGVGNQTEYYYEYTPNETIKPAIVNGEELYGRRDINQIAQQMKNDGMHPIMLLNADFFSLETGVPMSDCVIDGEIITKGGVGTDAIGINEDGSAFMAWMHLYTSINVEGTSVSANLINKYRQPYALYMLTDKFGGETHAKGMGTNVIIGEFSGDVKINNTVTGVVEQIIHTDGSIEIPDEDIEITAHRSSGAGGQHINKTDSAIRIVHLPTGIVVGCQTERSQLQNKETALKMLKSKLAEIKEREKLEKIEDIQGNKTNIEWGAQIRSYVFMPYTLAKDTRTGYEDGNIQAVMDGDIDGFINAFLKKNAKL